MKVTTAQQNLSKEVTIQENSVSEEKLNTLNAGHLDEGGEA